LRASRRRKRLQPQTRAQRGNLPWHEAPTAATYLQSETSLAAKRLLRTYERQRDLPGQKATTP